MRTACSCYQAVLLFYPHRPRLTPCQPPSDQTLCFLRQPQPSGLEGSSGTSQGPDWAPQQGKHAGRSRAGAGQQGKHSLKQHLYSLEVRQSCPRADSPPSASPPAQHTQPSTTLQNQGGNKPKATAAAEDTKEIRVNKPAA